MRLPAEAFVAAALVLAAAPAIAQPIMLRGRTGAAQEALERAETRLLNRSTSPGQAGAPDATPAGPPSGTHRAGRSVAPGVSGVAARSASVCRHS